MIGRNIKYYRLMKGISQEDLAQKIGLNKMAVSNYEKDKRNPDMATIQGIAKALDISLAALLSQQDQQLCIEHGAFRKHSTIKKGTQELILGKLDRYLGRLFNVISILGEAVLAPRPSIERIRAKSNEEAGQYLRRLLGLPSSGPVGNITDILENQGFIICPVDMDERGFSGNSGFVNGRPYIAVNTTMPAEMQRFTLVHELAHLVFIFNDDEDEEKLVDGIAGAFLLPEQDIKRELGPKRTNIISDLAIIQKEYGVSMTSIAIRAYQTGIINKTCFDITNKWLSKNGMRSNAPSYMEPEKTHLLEQLTLRAVSEEEISVSKAAELLDRPFMEVRQMCFGGV